MTDLSSFTPAQTRAYHILKRGFQLRRPMTGNNVCFLHDPKNKLRGWKTGASVFQALLNAGLLVLQSNEYPFEIWVLKQ